MTTRSLAAVRSTGWKAGVTLATDLLVAVIFGGKDFQRWLNDPASETAGKGMVSLDRRRRVRLRTEGPSEEWIPFGCCNRSKYVRPRAACQRRSDVADQEGFWQTSQVKVLCQVISD